MKTQIKTKHLLSIINPLVDGIEYNGNNLKIDLNTLTEYVLSPKSKNIFQQTNDDLENLYKNIALYIINQDNSSLISLDLNKEVSIESGFFELVKAIYNKEENLYINLPEEGDNNLLIKSKKLKPIEINIPKAIDNDYLINESIFSSDNEKVNIDTKKNFIWKDEETVDNYSSTPWLINKINSFLNKSSKKNYIFTELDKLIQKIDINSIDIDDFNYQLFNLNNDYKFLLLDYIAQSNHPLFDIDFNKDIYKEKINIEIENKKFSTLSFLFENKRKYSSFDFTPYVNHQHTIEYLLSQTYYSGYNHKNDNFNLVNVYPYFINDKKEDKQIIHKYLNQIVSKTMSDTPYIPTDKLYNIPLASFNDKDILIKILPDISIDDFRKKLKASNVTIDLLNDKNFIIELALQKDLHAYKIESLLSELSPDDLNKELFLKVINNRPNCFNSILNLFYDTLKNNVELISDAHALGVKISEIPLSIIEETFLTQGSLKEENFKSLYLVSQDKVTAGNRLFHKKEDIQCFNEKYYKLENIFFATKDDNRYNWNEKHHIKLLKKIKNVDDIKNLISNIKNQYSYQYFNIDYYNLYKNLPTHLKANSSLVKEIPEILEYISFNDLPETLRYNKDIALKFISKEPNLIPKEFFNDINFALSYAEALDKGIVQLKDSPIFITKFFENQEITSNFHEYLNSYIKVVDLKQNLSQKTSTTKKNKI